VDIFEKVVAKMGPLGQYYEQGHGYYFFPKLEGDISSRMMYQGKERLVWSLNNYLGLANHPEVRKADAEAAARFGLAYQMGARMMSGQTIYHEQFEKEIAEFMGKEAAYLLNFGYQGMVSLIQSMVDRKDVIVYDAEAHACILDGMQLHFGKRFVYQHNDMASLEKQLQHATKVTGETGGGILVITEGVYGMAGDLGKLNEIVEFKKKYPFRLLVDDAHGFGTMGKTGQGTGEHFGVQDEIDIYFGTFAKAFAGIGGFIASTHAVINYLMYNLRSQVFAKSLPIAMTIGALKRLEILRTQPQLRADLWNVVHTLQNGLRERGLNIGKTESPVTPVYFSGGLGEASHIAYELRETYNIFCSVVIYPVVPKGVIMLRIIPTAVHTMEDVNYTLDAFTEVKKKLDSGIYSGTQIKAMKV
jgi:glycine C-acetyltransferase